jgi:hypothetical protein
MSTKAAEIEARVREHVSKLAGRGHWVCTGCGKRLRLGLKCEKASCEKEGMDGEYWVHTKVDADEPPTNAS